MRILIVIAFILCHLMFLIAYDDDNSTFVPTGTPTSFPSTSHPSTVFPTSYPTTSYPTNSPVSGDDIPTSTPTSSPITSYPTSFPTSNPSTLTPTTFEVPTSTPTSYPSAPDSISTTIGFTTADILLIVGSIVVALAAIAFFVVPKLTLNLFNREDPQESSSLLHNTYDKTNI